MIYRIEDSKERLLAESDFISKITSELKIEDVEIEISSVELSVDDCDPSVEYTLTSVYVNARYKDTEVYDDYIEIAPGDELETVIEKIKGAIENALDDYLESEGENE